MRWLFAPFRLVFHVVRRFHSERLAQTVAALSFSTLLGLVPMIAVGVGLLSHLPFAEGMNAALEKFLLANLLPEKAGIVIAKYVGQFAHRAASVTLVGVAVLLATALMQMLTIEHAFNAIWKIKAKRPWLRRVAMHLIALLLGPLAFGGSLAFISFVAGISFGLVNEPSWVSAAFFRGLSFVFMAGLFALLYWGVPNRPVLRWHAVAGGFFAAFGFLAMQRLFGDYIAHFPAYTVVYGAFAAVPIFLAWLYLSWTVILVGALIVAELPGSTTR
jgi:membrane protein